MYFLRLHWHLARTGALRPLGVSSLARRFKFCRFQSQCRSSATRHPLPMEQYLQCSNENRRHYLVPATQHRLNTKLTDLHLLA